MQSEKRYLRYEDMSPDGAVTVLRQEDGDVILGVIARPFRSGRLLNLSVEFCVEGGRSPHTWRALIALADAIERDNRENPIVQAEPEGGVTMDHLDPSQDVERRQAEQRHMPQECQCNCHSPREDGALWTKHVAPCCYPCVCGLNFASGLEEHQSDCEAYLISQQQG